MGNDDADDGKLLDLRMISAWMLLSRELVVS